MQKAILYDSTKCMACRGCQVACKRWWNLPAEKTSLSPEWTNPTDLSPITWNYIRFVGKTTSEEFKWYFTTVRCMHCVDPPCARVCPVDAITKYEEGPVVIDEKKCIGCKYCVAVCPFNVPRYEPIENKVYKCTMCYDRIREGLQPACAYTCPTGALTFGDRETLLKVAEERAVAIGGYVYGAKELGMGTSVFIVTKLPPAEMGLPTVPLVYPLHMTLREILKPLSGMAFMAALGAAIAISIAQFRARRMAKGT